MSQLNGRCRFGTVVLESVLWAFKQGDSSGLQDALPVQPCLQVYRIGAIVGSFFEVRVGTIYCSC